MNTKKTQMLNKAYDEYIKLMLYEFPVERISEIVVNDVTGYGTTVDEKILDLNRLKKIVIDQREQGVDLDMQFSLMPVKRRISPDKDTAIYMDEFEISMIVNETKNVLPVRLTSVFEFRENGWKLVHLHGSKAVETEEDTWHLSEWKQKNEQLQKLVAEKTAELTIQNRELEIEAALERVRACSMGMNKSEELVEVVRLLDKEIAGLGVEVNGSQIVTDFANPEKSVNVWYARKGQNYMEKFHIPYLEHPLTKRVYNALQKNVDFYTENYSKAEKNKYFRLLFKYSDFGKISKERQEFIYQSPAWIRAVVVSKNSFLVFHRYELKEFTREEEGIFKRFGKVFEQAYTRFLDLQKAEAQAREAQIEAALEKVRSRSMAMHKSEELHSVVNKLYGEFQSLNVQFHVVAIQLLHDNSKDLHIWLATADGLYDNIIHWPFTDLPVFHAIYRARTTGEMLEHTMNKAATREFFKEFFKLKAVPKERKTALQNVQVIDVIGAYQKLTGIFLNRYSEGSYSHYEKDIVRRFSIVFEQTYTRFLDLQKAEAQAREAQIEAALERVRAKAMSMQNSEDLNATIGTFYRELEQFSITPRRCGVGLLQKNRIAELSTMNTMEQGNSIEIIGKLKMEGHWVLDGVYDNWCLQKEFHPVLRGNEIKEYNQILKPQMDFPEYPNDSVQFGYFFFFPEGGVYAWTEKEMKEDELNIYRKFTTVLSLTYKRYKDLKDAEANAREAVRRASLDRVRAEIASMRTVDDLQRITPIIWHELTVLGVPFLRCGVFIMNEETEQIQVYLSTPDGHSLAALDLSFHSSKLAVNTVDHWRRGIIFKSHWNKQEFIDWMKSMIELGQVQNQVTYQGASKPPESLDLHFVPFKQGMLYVGNSSPLEPDELQLVKSLAESFSIAYARYEDFRQLEEAKNQIEKTLTELKSTQAQLIHAEKMASLGELTAGIAHEIQNPLNFVNNFSEISNELIDEIEEERDKEPESRDEKLVSEILSDIKQNLEKINHHGNRADAIVKGMLQHSRSSNGQKEPTDINALADEYLRLSYHGLRAKDKSFNADFKTDFDPTLPKINVIPQDIGRVLLNLINNAFYAVNERSRSAVSEKMNRRNKDLEGFQNLQGLYKPTVTVSTKKLGDKIEISVKDNGNGILPEIKNKIFQPFFTTKPTGQGTGLGLSLSYDIVKAHGGEIQIDSVQGCGSEFKIILPFSNLK